MYDEVKTLLEAMGLTVTDGDILLTFAIQSVEQMIKNETNQRCVPEGLSSVWTYRAAGLYLSFLKGAGKLEGFELSEGAVTAIKMGDTSFSFTDATTPEQRLSSLISYLSNYGSSQFSAYRRLAW